MDFSRQIDFPALPVEGPQPQAARPGDDVVGALEALGDRFLEAVVVGSSLCLYQPVTQAVALVAQDGIDPGASRLPDRETLLANGFLIETPAVGPRAENCCAGDVDGLSETAFVGTYGLGGGAKVALFCSCAWLGPRLAAVLAPLAMAGVGAGAGRSVRLAIRPDGAGTVAFHLDGRVVGAGVDRARARRLALNIVLVEALRHVGVGAIVHGAAVARDGRAAVIVGASGEGKSTLALGLAARGWLHLADDLVALSATGEAIAAFPVAASVKEESWAVLEKDFPALSEAPVFAFGERRVRYVDAHAGGAVPEGSWAAGLIVVARRVEGVERATVERLSPEAAFSALLESGSEAVGDPPSMTGLAALVNTTQAVRLSFDNASEADVVLRGLMDGGEASNG